MVQEEEDPIGDPMANVPEEIPEEMENQMNATAMSEYEDAQSGEEHDDVVTAIMII